MSYQYIKPTDEQVAQMQVFRDKFETLHDSILRSCSGEGEATASLKQCLIKLQESSFWLNKHITVND